MSLVRADARALPLADGCVQCVVTSPPYFNLRDYGVAGQIGLEPTPDAYVQQLVAVFREVRRVLADDGVLWLNLGDSYHATVRGTSTTMGPKSSTFHGQSKQFHPTERFAVGSDVKPKDLLGIPWRVAFALQADGWYLRSDIIWHKPNPMPESVTDRPTKAHEYLFLLSKSQSYYYDADAIREPFQDINHPVGSDGKFINPKAAGGVSSKGWTPPIGSRFVTSLDVREYNPLGRNRRSVWTIPTMPYPGAHFATFPESLVEPCVLAGSRYRDRVLDPFGGTGTVVRVARRFGRIGIATELNPEYLRLARERIAVTGGLPLEETA